MMQVLKIREFFCALFLIVLVSGCRSAEASRGALPLSAAALREMAAAENLQVRTDEKLRELAGIIARPQEYLARLREYVSGDRGWLERATCLNDPRFAYGVNALLIYRIIAEKPPESTVSAFIAPCIRCLLDFEVSAQCAALSAAAKYNRRDLEQAAAMELALLTGADEKRVRGVRMKKSGMPEPAFPGAVSECRALELSLKLIEAAGNPRIAEKEELRNTVFRLLDELEAIARRHGKTAAGTEHDAYLEFQMSLIRQEELRELRRIFSVQ